MVFICELIAWITGGVAAPVKRAVKAKPKPEKHGGAVQRQAGGKPVTAPRPPHATTKPRARKPKLPSVKPNFSMFDSTEVSTVPAKPTAVAGYVGGFWPTYAALLKSFPTAKHLSVAVTASEDAECLDVETGDATPAQVPAWVRRQQKRGVHRPVLYANLSTMPLVIAALKRAGIKLSAVRLWVAHYTYKPHIPAGFDACQYTDRALGRNLDESLCRGDFL